MSNILQALIRIAENNQANIESITSGNNRMNTMGEGLENYIKYVFADALHEQNETIRKEKINQTFSYTGNKNNPPDMILKGGDAIEVKKIQSVSSNLQLNSSHPKAKLRSDNPKINKACRTCEAWEEKDLIYCIGYIKEKKLMSLWMVYGDCYAAEETTYTKVEQKIKETLSQIDDLEINQDTNELSGIKNVDPLGITYLRIRGMWIIENPSKVYNYLYQTDPSAPFQLIALMRTKKYFSFPNDDRRSIETHKLLSVKDVKIENPNNPAQLVDAKLIMHKVGS